MQKIISPWEFPWQITCLYAMGLGNVFANPICGSDNADDQISCVREI